eukprot:CAMPEP_0178525946 /NCGR_PEP_ID=MMETSP0696-20121128/30462_1 /TAXON_ID=265572 /ORGANISM="Extubocellulus spinifer, Strain CCMP396" /LENGTH=59 /DNA_ID=CAMNT_0020157411 /DNA_START=443 /DNA_END=622 /DNA_ORIENTATION=-
MVAEEYDGERDSAEDSRQFGAIRVNLIGVCVAGSSSGCTLGLSSFSYDFPRMACFSSLD